MADRGGERDASVRVSDSERESVAEALREHCGDGRLTLDELSERLESTFAARTRVELDAALADLPRLPAQSPGLPIIPPDEVQPRRRSTGWTISVMGDSSHRGRWRPKAVTNVIALMGTCELDLRQAEVEGPEVVINAVSLMGHVEIVVPEGIEVELSGIPIMGSSDLRLRPVAPIPGAPRVRVRAFMLMGDVRVRSKRHHDEFETANPDSEGYLGRGLAAGRGLGAGRGFDRFERRAERRGWR